MVFTSVQCKPILVSTKKAVEYLWCLYPSLMVVLYIGLLASEPWKKWIDEELPFCFPFNIFGLLYALLMVFAKLITITRRIKRSSRNIHLMQCKLMELVKKLPQKQNHPKGCLRLEPKEKLIWPSESLLLGLLLILSFFSTYKLFIHIEYLIEDCKDKTECIKKTQRFSDLSSIFITTMLMTILYSMVIIFKATLIWTYLKLTSKKLTRALKWILIGNELMIEALLMTMLLFWNLCFYNLSGFWFEMEIENITYLGLISGIMLLNYMFCIFIYYYYFKLLDAAKVLSSRPYIKLDEALCEKISAVSKSHADSNV